MNLASPCETHNWYWRSSFWEAQQNLHLFIEFDHFWEAEYLLGNPLAIWQSFTEHFFTFLVQKLNHVLLTQGSDNSCLNMRTRNQTESLTDGPRGSDYCLV